MKLSDKAKRDLRAIIANMLGNERADGISDEELNTIGLFFLSAVSEYAKLYTGTPELFTFKRE